MSTVQGKVAVITGASRGLGAGLARVFAREGVRLALCGRTPAGQVELPGGSEKSLYRRVDVTDVDAVEAFATEVEATLGPIDLWVNNAGLLAPIGMTSEVDPFLFKRLMDVNVLGVYHGSRAFLRRSRERGQPGALINISSGASHHAYAGWGAYCASKAAVDQLSRVLAIEEGDGGSRVWSLAPGIIETGMQEMIRRQDVGDFPAVDEFRRLSQDGALADVETPGPLVLKLAFGPQPDTGDCVVDARDLSDAGYW